MQVDIFVTTLPTGGVVFGTRNKLLRSCSAGFLNVAFTNAAPFGRRMTPVRVTGRPSSARATGGGSASVLHRRFTKSAFLRLFTAHIGHGGADVTYLESAR